ncbi:TIM barrel protein [Candidatus Sumerlaeota bacterium]|nr:TIM barrel protein [Candidatus Sumerlaeota bacterium]
MDRRRFVTAAGVGTGLAAFAPRPTRAAEPTDAKLRQLGKTSLKIALQPGMFRGMPFLEALDQIAAHGFPAFESLGEPRGASLDDVKRKMDQTGLAWSCIGGVGGIGKPGGRDYAFGDEANHEQLEQRFRERVETAKKMGIKRILITLGQKHPDMTQDQQTAIVVKGIKRLAPIAAEAGVTIAAEMLNILVNHPGYFLVYTPHGVEIVQAVNSPNVKLTYDIYHQQISEGHLISNITKNIQHIAHFHIGDNPGRQYPGTGEINYRNVFKAILQTKYDGFLAMECGYGDKKPIEIMQIMRDLTMFG